MLRWYFHPYYLEHSAEILEYIKGACEISTLYRSSRPLFHRGLVLHTYCRFISMTLPEDFLSLHLARPLVFSQKERGGICQPLRALHDMERTDGRRVSSPPAAARSRCQSSSFGLAAQKRGANDDTTRQTNGRTVGRSDGICV